MNRTTTPSNFYFMWQLFTYRPWPQLVSGFCWIIFHSWALWPGLLAKAFFDLLTDKQNATFSLPTLLILVIGLALIRTAVVYLDVFVGNTVGMRVRGLVQFNLLTRILARPGAKALPGTVGEALSTLRDDVEAMWGAGWAFDVIAYTIFAIGGLAILLWVNALITLLVFMPIIIVFLLAHGARSRLQEVRTASRAATAQVTGALSEIFSNVQTIQVAGAERHLLTYFQQLGAQRQQAMLRDQLLELVLNATFANTASLGAGLTMLVAATAMRTDQFTIGDFALFTTYLMQVTEMTGFLGWMVAAYQQMGVAFRRGVELLQGTPPTMLVEHHPIPLNETLPTIPASTKVQADYLEQLTTERLTFHYPQSQQGITNVSFTLTRGSLTVVTGRVGAGKTTLLRTVLGLLPAQSGSIMWNGQPITEPGTFLIPPRAAYIPQVPTLLSGTIHENILLGVDVEPELLMAAVYHAALDGDLAMLPDGLETQIGVRGVKLSGGQIQRTAAARMFIRDAELLVMDDLSSALDIETEQLLWQRFFQRSQSTCLVVSHRPALLAKADQILEIEQGSLKSVIRR